MHTTRERTRNASGDGGSSNKVVPILGGIAGGALTVLATEKLGKVPPLAVAAGAAVLGFAVAANTKEPWMRQAATAAAIGAGTLGGVQAIAGWLAPPSVVKRGPGQKAGEEPAQAPPRPATRGDDGYVSRRELNEALSRVAESQTKQCDLMTALRDEIQATMARSQSPQRMPPPRRMARERACDSERNAYGDDYERNAYGDEYERNAYGDEYERNAYGDDYERNAYGDDYERNAYGDEYERNAYGDDGYERNAYGDDGYERNAYGDDYERNAYGDDYERNAYGDEHPDSA